MAVAPIKPGIKRLEHIERVKQVIVSLRWILPGERDLSLKQRYGINQGKYILGGGSNSLLFRRLRQELHWVYKTGASFSNYPTAIEFEVWAAVEPEMVEKTILEMKGIVNKFLDKGVGKEDFRRVKNYMNMMTYVAFDSVSGIAQSLVNDLHYHNEVHLPEERVRVANMVKQEEIRELLGKYLGVEPFVGIMREEK